MTKAKQTYLIDFDGNRHNNFTLIRIIFAWLVLYGHSYAIQKTPGIRDPLNSLFQGSLWVGELAVLGFFAISGFLVTASLIRRDVIDYTLSRMLRILPALFICVFASALILGPLMTSLSIQEYFSTSETYKYLRNSLAFMDMRWTLPGVFETNVRDAINGSLWTLTVEAKCYFILAVIGVFGILKNRAIANIFLISLLIFSYYYYSEIPLIGHKEKWARPALFFLIGILFYINRSSIILDFRLALLALALVLLSFGEPWFVYVFPVSFIYLIFYISYKTKYRPVDENIGDISYGIYIYAWPTQQVVAYFTPDGDPYSNTLLSSIIVIILAYLSWHKIEKPMLGHKKNLLNKKGFNLKMKFKKNGATE